MFDIGKLFSSMFEFLIGKLFGFFVSLGKSFISILVDILQSANNVLPDPTNLLHFINDLFTLVSPYIAYIKDLTLINPLVLNYLVLSIIFRFLAKKNVYLVKVITGWIKKLRS